MLQLQWVKNTEGNWCGFEGVNLADVKTQGVYIIWHAGDPSRVVRVGQGDIKARLLAHRQDPEITAHRKSGKLHVTWAAVPAAQMDGVETYLADRWTPLVGDAFPDCQPIAVNDPW